MLDSLSKEEIAVHFPAHCERLSEAPLLFYWWGEKNVGDLVTPYFLRRVCGVDDPELMRVPESDLHVHPHRSAIRSIVDFLKGRTRTRASPRYSLSTGSVMRLCSQRAVVYGSGIRSRDQLVQPGICRIVRGPITRMQVLASGGECPPIFGDPGLLMSRYYEPAYSSTKVQLAIVPHFTEYETVKDLYANDRRISIVDMGCGDIEHVIEEIVAAEAVVSSSLHGIIFANSYGVPVRWIKFSSQVHGDDTKYHDYFSSIGRKDEDFIPAIEFKRLPVEQMLETIENYPLSIDLDRIQDEMFFDSNGFRCSARFE